MKAKIDERIKEEYEAKIIGKFKIYLGNKLYAKGKNKWTRYFVSSLVQIVANPGIWGRYENCTTHLISYNYTARAGNDTTTPTSPDMTDLVSKIDIAPDTQNIVLFKEADYTKYQSRHKFSWGAGTIPAQIIGEFGVYLYLSDDSWTSPNETFPVANNTSCPYINPAVRLGARISSGDGDFDPIDYDSSEALIFEWYVTIKF